MSLVFIFWVQFFFFFTSILLASNLPRGFHHPVAVIGVAAGMMLAGCGLCGYALIHHSWFVSFLCCIQVLLAMHVIIYPSEYRK